MVHSEEYLTDSRELWWNDDYLSLLSKLMCFDRCEVVVDMGCGKGHLLRSFSQYLPKQCKKIGYDLEKSHIDDARKLCSNINNISFFVGDVYDIPVNDNVADICYCQTLFIHLKDPICALREMKRITKPGGLIVSIEPNNMIGSLLLDSIDFGFVDIEKKKLNVEIQLCYEKGKMMMGDGYDSIGELMPSYYKELSIDIKDIRIADKAMYAIPPYGKASQLLFKEHQESINKKNGWHNYEYVKKCFLKGGGDIKKLELYWLNQQRTENEISAKIQNSTYMTCGGGLLYIIIGKK